MSTQTTPKKPGSNPKTKAREYALQFLYQCELEKLYHFSDAHLAAFAEHQQIARELVPLVRELVQGTLEHMGGLDVQIQSASSNWKLTRMSVVDRNVLRLAAFELSSTPTPKRVVLNEAVELAKTFGSDDSSRFVNGLLDRIANSGVPAS